MQFINAKLDALTVATYSKPKEEQLTKLLRELREEICQMYRRVDAHINGLAQRIPPNRTNFCNKDSVPATEDHFGLIVELLDIYNKVVHTGELVHCQMLSPPQVPKAGWINAVTLTTQVTNKDKECLDLPFDRITYLHLTLRTINGTIMISIRVIAVMINCIITIPTLRQCHMTMITTEKNRLERCHPILSLPHYRL